MAKATARASSGRAAPGTRNRPAPGPAAAAGTSPPSSEIGILAISTPSKPAQHRDDGDQRSGKRDGCAARSRRGHGQRSIDLPSALARRRLRRWRRRGRAWVCGGAAAARLQRRLRRRGRRRRCGFKPGRFGGQSGRWRAALPAAWGNSGPRHPGWRRHRPAARRASRLRRRPTTVPIGKARRQQPAIAGTDRPGRPACRVTVWRQHVQRRRGGVVAGHDGLDVAAARW